MGRRNIERTSSYNYQFYQIFRYLHRFVVDSFDKGPEEHCGSIGTRVTLQREKMRFYTGIFVPNDHYEPVPWRGEGSRAIQSPSDSNPRQKFRGTHGTLSSYCTFREGYQEDWKPFAVSFCTPRYDIMIRIVSNRDMNENFQEEDSNAHRCGQPLDRQGPRPLFGKACKRRRCVLLDTSGSIRNSCRNTFTSPENYYTATLRSCTEANQRLTRS